MHKCDWNSVRVALWSQMMWVTSGGGWCYIAFFEVLADAWIFHVSMESKGGRQGAVVTMGG